MKLKKNKILSIIALIIFCIGFYPAISELVEKWSNSDEYSHAFITIPIIGYMIWLKRGLLLDNNKSSSHTGFILLIASLAIYLLSLQLQIPTFTFLSMIMAVFSVIIFLGGFGVIKNLITPLILLILIIPIPNQVYSMITLPLQLKVSQLSTKIVQIFGVTVYREGNVIHIPEKTFQIVEACSGMRSLITLITLSLIFSYFTLKTNRMKIALVAASIPVAFFINLIRVSLLILAFHYYRIDLTEGTYHTLLGIGVFVIALAALFIIQKILEKWELKKKNSCS